MAKVRFERRMSDQDALMWAIEKDPLLRSTITSVSLLDVSPDRWRFEQQVERATREVPRLRQRVVSAPFNLAPPEFAVDPNFDPRYHVRWLRAPGHGSLRDVLDLAAPFAMSGFDRARPLWEFVVVDGLADGKAVLMQKMHHSLTDGVGAMKLSMAFLDTKRDPTRPRGELPDIPRPERPTTTALVTSALRHRVRRQGGVARRLPTQARVVAQNPIGAVRASVDLCWSTGRMLRPVSSPLSPIMTGRSLSVRFDTINGSLTALKQASKRVDGRLNDAFVAAVAGGLHRYHEKHGVPVDALRMTMPINVRPDNDELVAGNQFVPARFTFPISIVDPLERMRALKTLVRTQRAEPALRIVEPIAGILNRLPAGLTTSLFGGMLKAIDVVTSNVPGAPIPVYVAGARIEGTYGFGPLSGAASNITLLSYVDDLHIAVNTDPAAIPDPDVFVSCLEDGLDEIQALA
jgi:diacylglycerol O-acyltransferase / wax synthase